MTPSDFRPPVTLHGRYLDLVPLDQTHVAPLARAGKNPLIWTFILSGPGKNEAEMSRLVDHLLGLQEKGTDLPFTILRKSDHAAVGMTRFLNIDRENRTVEVGGTWFDTTFWRTPFNTDSKLLMLGHAFETERALRVQLKTDIRNLRSQKAIERIGAVREGIMRDHLILADGTVRSSVIYSIVAREWPSVKERLTAMLGRTWGTPADASRSAGATGLA